MCKIPRIRIIPTLLVILAGLLAPPTWATCGDILLDPGETCDDGNTAPGDGCSAACLVEPGWACTAPGPADTNAVADGSLEQGPAANPDWNETSTSALKPICSFYRCGISASDDRTWFAWMGGSLSPLTQTLEQENVPIPLAATELRFRLFEDGCDAPANTFKAKIDTNTVYTGVPCSGGAYATITVDLATAAGGPYNNGGTHDLLFEFVRSTGGAVTSYIVDSIEIAVPATPVASSCSILETFFTV